MGGRRSSQESGGQSHFVIVTHCNILSGGRGASEHLAVQGASRRLGDQQSAQQEDDAQAPKHQSYQVLDNCKDVTCTQNPIIKVKW